jgi:hypothetical protein
VTCDLTESSCSLTLEVFYAFIHCVTVLKLQLHWNGLESICMHFILCVAFLMSLVIVCLLLCMCTIIRI